MKSLIVLLCILFIGCNITKDISRSKAEKYYRNHPEEFARQCADKYPPSLTGNSQIKYIYVPADYDSAYDAIINEAQEWIQRTQEQTYEDTAASGIVYRKKLAEASQIISQLKNHKPIPDTIREYRVDTVLDTRMLAENNALKQELSAARSDAEKAKQDSVEWKGKARTRNWWLIGICSVIGLSFVGWIVSRFKTINIKK